jgi:hypothetical protein
MPKRRKKYCLEQATPNAFIWCTHTSGLGQATRHAYVIWCQLRVYYVNIKQVLPNGVMHSLACSELRRTCSHVEQVEHNVLLYGAGCTYTP